MELSQYQRLRPHEVERLHGAIGGDPVTEEAVLLFIGSQYRARSLFYLPPTVAEKILQRPAAFLRAARCFAQPEVPF
jgi:hypothetical protein